MIVELQSGYLGMGVFLLGMFFATVGTVEESGAVSNGGLNGI